MATEASKNRIDALAVVALAASSLFITVGSYVINQHGVRLDRKDARITTLEIGFAKLDEHSRQHDQTATHWIQEIIDAAKQINQTERRVDRLETRPSARPDPFTGKDGKRLELLIEELQRRIGN